MKTTDLGLAATIVTYGYQILKMNRLEKKVEFVFQNRDAIDKIAKDYWNHKLEVEPLTYFANLKSIKSRIYQ